MADATNIPAGNPSSDELPIISDPPGSSQPPGKSKITFYFIQLDIDHQSHGAARAAAPLAIQPHHAHTRGVDHAQVPPQASDHAQH
jgi:hypothetical protein